MPRVTRTRGELFVARKVCIDLSPRGELFVACDVGKDLAVSGYGELFVAHDPGESTQRTPSGFATNELTPSGFATNELTPSGFATDELTPSGFASTRYPLDKGVSHHGELFVACDDRDITQCTPSGFATTWLTPSGFAATCYPTLDTTQNAATSSGHRKGIRDSSRMPLLGANTPTVSAHTQSLHMGSSQRVARPAEEHCTSRSSASTATTPGSSKAIREPS